LQPDLFRIGGQSLLTDMRAANSNISVTPLLGRFPSRHFA